MTPPAILTLKNHSIKSYLCRIYVWYIRNNPPPPPTTNHHPSLHHPETPPYRRHHTKNATVNIGHQWMSFVVLQYYLLLFHYTYCICLTLQTELVMYPCPLWILVGNFSDVRRLGCEIWFDASILSFAFISSTRHSRHVTTCIWSVWPKWIASRRCCSTIVIGTKDWLGQYTSTIVDRVINKVSRLDIMLVAIQCTCTCKYLIRLAGQRNDVFLSLCLINVFCIFVANASIKTCY